MSQKELSVPKRMSTKEYLALVLHEMLKQTPFEKIKVKDILERAQISRTTFYRHFTDKYDLLVWFYRDKLAHAGVTTNDFRKNSLITFGLMAEDPKTFRSALMYDKQNSLTDYIVQLAREFFTENMKKRLGVNTLPDDVVYSIEFYCGGSKQIWYDWLFGKMTETPEQITEIIIQHMPGVLLQCIE